jgi:hypothetical protein
VSGLLGPLLIPWLHDLMVVSLYPAIGGAILLVFAGLVASRTVALVPGLLREFAISGRVLPYAYDAVTDRTLAARRVADFHQPHHL